MNARLALEAEATDEIEVALFLIEHPDLEAPIRLSTDNTERLQSDPLIYGTRSSWRGSDPVTQPFLWIVASAILPGDAEDDSPVDCRPAERGLQAGRRFTQADRQLNNARRPE